MNRDLNTILLNDAVEAFEAAKRLIASGRVDPNALVAIATDKRNGMWSRRAATYTLGFVDRKSKSAIALLSIISDKGDDPEVRAYAAEALAHLKSSKILPVMEQILMSDDSSTVKRWCIFALGVIDSEEARGLLERVARTNPTGEVMAELQELGIVSSSVSAAARNEAEVFKRDEAMVSALWVFNTSMREPPLQEQSLHGGLVELGRRQKESFAQAQRNAAA
jgi:HEAT repeat protein